ncbi:LysM peptidoglycan-binding domain-containing protein [Nocardioides sp. GXZ039]|uniref:LysM peptidoglycan-binding domain-containing protein n=1 Tax=Nocardioides sp. GXZ039 TaxID=3136018 RepID=UPI0030F3A1C5
MSTTLDTFDTLDRADVREEYVPVYRLTRRGRLVLFALAFLVLLAIGVVFASNSMATAEPQATETVVVAPGETLWSIASDVAEGDDVREMMSYLVDLNDLPDVTLDAGQQLIVPAG